MQIYAGFQTGPSRAAKGLHALTGPQVPKFHIFIRLQVNIVGPNWYRKVGNFAMGRAGDR